jgi:PadR family transcriptional regulator PadR
MSQSFGRDLLRGSLDLMVLSVLADEPQYGYVIQKRICEASGDQVKLQAGTLYPLLHRLESDKLIRSKWDRSSGRGRKWYSLTAAGQRRLSQHVSEWFRYVECLGQLLEPVMKRMPRPA